MSFIDKDSVKRQLKHKATLRVVNECVAKEMKNIRQSV